MGKKRYVVKLGEIDGDLKIYHVWDLTEVSDPDNLKQFEAHHVWGSDYKWEKFRCASCHGPLTAMSASCRHAKAVKRYVDSQAPVVPQEEQNNERD